MNFTHKLAHERPTLWPIPNIHPQCLSSLEPMLSEAQIPQSIRFQSSIGPPNPPQNSHNSIKILPPIPTNSTFHPTFFPLQGTPHSRYPRLSGATASSTGFAQVGANLGPSSTMKRPHFFRVSACASTKCLGERMPRYFLGPVESVEALEIPL